MHNDHPTDDILHFDGHAIRILMQDGIPLFSLDDLGEAMGLDQPTAARMAHGSTFPAHARRTCLEIGDDGETSDIIMLTPVGVWLLTHLVDARRFQKLAAWSKREALRLCPEPRPDDPAMFLTLDRYGELPPCPTKYSGRSGEWWALKNDPARWEARAKARSPLSAMLRQRREAALNPSAN